MRILMFTGKGGVGKTSLATLARFRSRHCCVAPYRTTLFNRYFGALLSLTRQMIDPGVDHAHACNASADTKGAAINRNTVIVSDRRT